MTRTTQFPGHVKVAEGYHKVAYFYLKGETGLSDCVYPDIKSVLSNLMGEPYDQSIHGYAFCAFHSGDFSALVKFLNPDEHLQRGTSLYVHLLGGVELAVSASEKNARLITEPIVGRRPEMGRWNTDKNGTLANAIREALAGMPPKREPREVEDPMPLSPGVYQRSSLGKSNGGKLV